MPDDLSDEIAENAKGPKRARGDEGEVEQHPLKDQIDADRYLKSKEAAEKGPKSLKWTKVVPPGSA